MRILWWGALALLLTLAVTSALRTQTNSTSRVNRRFSNSNRNPISANKTEDVAPTSRAQVSRRREENTFRSKPTEIASRTRSRNKPTERLSSLTNLSESTTERTEQFDSKKSNSRIRNRRPVIDEANFDTTLSREKVKSKSRQTSRYSTIQTVEPKQSLVQTSSSVETSTKTPGEISNYGDPSTSVKEVTGNQFRRRSSTIRTVEAIPASRPRGRINTRTDLNPLDLEVSGTAYAFTSAPRDPTTVRNGEIRNSRKLKYRTRQTETDTNLTGEGIISNERKSTQTREHVSNQAVLKKNSRSSTENIVEQYTEKSAARATKVIKRPVSRGKAKSAVKVVKPKGSDEVGEDDNYPENFKALIQAKNASFQTHTSSPSSESLSVKASQKVFQTLTTTPQSFPTTPDVEKQTPLRNKLNAEDDQNSTPNVIVETVSTDSEDSIVKPAEYRLRGTYTPRIKTITSSFAPIIETSTLSSSTHRSYKFSRKAKTVTTETPLVENATKQKRFENNLSNKKPVIRSSFYPKRNSTRNLNITSNIPRVTVTERSNGVRTFNKYKSRQILPRTSYYSRLRSSTVNDVTTTELSAKDEETVIFADKKMENTVEVPLIYTSLNSPSNSTVNTNSINHQDDSNYSHQPFIIKVNSKESIENSTDNEIISNVEGNENEHVTNIGTTTHKYHATYKDTNKVHVDESKDNGISTLQPPIRNIQTRKFSRKPTRQNEEYSIVTPKYRDRNLRKYSDTFSKTTEASSNGIIAERDKPKSKFSSKYRASYLNKPFYKPTVPTITTSTVEGEEIQLGLDMNAISFTKTRSPLTSADLKLSESLAKPLQVMNVEASHHSPSVTVSIFDALAEILTSTPRPRISSTTEVQQNQNSNSDVKQTFDAVSNNINVNSVKDITSQDTVVSKDNVNTITQSVQITEKATPNVINRMPFGGTSTPSLNIEDENTFSVTTPKIFPFTTPFISPTLPPTTPLSARKPFAIKVLYAETEPPRDKMTSVSTLNMAMTDNPKMVYNTVSNPILYNNKLVSSELTSMLSNNIKNIIQNMDDGSKDRLSVEMVKLLNSLIPKLQKPMTAKVDGDSFPNTTPYSIEDIKDTENIVIDGKEVLSISSTNILQNVNNDTIVNSTFGSTPVNSPLNEEFGSTASTLGGKIKLESIEQSTDANTFSSPNPTLETTTFSTSILESLTNAPSVDVFINNDNSLNLNGKQFTNNNTLVPFLTNFELNDFMSISNITDSTNNPNSLSNVSEFTLNRTSVSTPSLQIRELEDIDKIEDPSQLSRLQLWILSKKARVLKMIEDLILNHNDEIANAPLVELITDSKVNNLSFSNRLSEIVETMTTTTRNSDITTENILTSTVMTNNPDMTTLIPQTPLPTQSITTIMSADSSESMVDFLTTTEKSFSESNTRINEIEQSTTLTSNVDTTIISTTSVTDEVSTTLQSQETDTTIVNNVDVTTPNYLGETTIDTDSVTESSITTEKNVDFTTLGGIETSSSSQINNVNNVSNELNIATTASIPKKDYVIFGILPNNTVVRKNPNDNILESLTEASPYIIYGVLPNNTIIRKFPNGTRVPRIMPKIDILPISPWSLRNPYSPIHNIPAIVRPQSNPIRVSTNTVTSTDTSNNGSENRLTNDTVNNLQITTKQIRTEKPGDKNGNAIFKFIPIDQVTVPEQESNVFKLGSTKMPITLTTDIQTSTIPSVTESSTQTKVQNFIKNEDSTSTVQAITEMISESTRFETTEPSPTITESIISQTTMTTPVQIQTTTERATTVTSTLMTTIPTTVTAEPVTLSNIVPIPTLQATTNPKISDKLPLTVTAPSIKHSLETASSNQNEAELLQSLLQELGRSPKNLNSFDISDRPTKISSQINNDQLLQSVITSGALNSKNLMSKAQTTTSRSIEDEIRQFEEDTKLLKALLQATGRDPSALNLPSLDNIRKVTGGNTVTIQPSTTTRMTTTMPPTTTRPTTTTRQTTTLPSTTLSINENIRKLQEETKLLQALLQATRNKNTVNLPVISGITSNVRVASNPFTTSLGSNPTTPVNIRPVYTTRPLPIITTFMPGTTTVSELQPQQQNGDEFGISTTFRPFNERSTTTDIGVRSTTSRSAKSLQSTITTEMPSSSTFSDEEDLLFLQNLKSVLSTKTGDGDPETALANRVIALAVEKSLNEIQTGKVSTTTNRPTTTTRTTTTTRRITTTTVANTPSIEEDIKQFEQDTKLLQALLKATGQDPSKLNIPTLPPNNRLVAETDSFKAGNPTTVKPYGAKIAVKDELKNEQDDAKLLQTLIQLQDAQETTTQRSKIALTGQSSDEALKKLLQQAQPTGMLSEATKSSVSLSTEYGNSNDALLAALLKEQGFGPTTASSLDEQLRLAALLNQVVVTPKARKTTTRPPPPPPPSPRRPVLDGLAWLWQQWRETGPGPGGARPNRRPAPPERPSPSSAETSSRVNWFGSGPFVGNADEKPSSNRIPLEPPSAVTDQGPGRGQLVSAAINVTRAFSQFLGAAIQGAAQTVQSVFKYGQRAATDNYTNGSG